MEPEEIPTPRLRPYQLLSNQTEIQCKKGVGYTLLKSLCYIFAVLNLLVSLGALGLYVIYIGLVLLLNAFESVPRHDTVYVVAMLHTVILTLTSIIWMVMTGYFIRSLVNKKRIRGPKILCRQMLHTSAVWIIVLRVTLISTVRVVDPLDFENILLVMLIEPALNALFIFFYYCYAVKLNFGLISDDAILD